MRKFLLPVQLLVTFIGTLCLLFSFYGFEYLNKALFIIIILILIINIFITLYNLITKMCENKKSQMMHILFYSYIVIIYLRLFFDKNMLYVNSVLETRYEFINNQLIVILMGLLSLTLFQIIINLENNKKR